jgi:signal transduction histidine kinase
MKSSRALPRCGAKGVVSRRPTDIPLSATPEELRSIKAGLATITRFLIPLFGEAYDLTPASFAARAEVADLIDRNFDVIVERWRAAAEAILGDGVSKLALSGRALSEDLANALIRFMDHLRDPDDIQTYVHLLRHCQAGILSRAEPSQFNTIHIALKQVILGLIGNASHQSRREVLRNTVVAAIDERRLMVSLFYIEARERALRLSEEKYRNAINHAPDPMYEIELDTWRVLSANSAAERLHAEMADSSTPLRIGSMTDLVPPEHRSEVDRHLRSVVQGGTDLMLDLQIGSRYFDVNSSLIPFGDNRFIQVILHDVTARREMLDELLKAERLAAAGTFAAGVAHEVNNPLASISSLVQSLLSGETDAARRTTLHTMLSQITRISATLRDLMNFARPSTVQRQPVDLNQLVIETLRLVSYNKKFRGVALEPELAPDLKLAFVDINEIQQVLMNLLLNAADATASEGGVIRVITENHPSSSDGSEVVRKVKVRVIDNGIGIPREHLEKIFDPFFTTKPAGAGTGLGLSLCQRIVLGNRGTIKVESEVGRGTTVTISLPAHDPMAEADASRGANP